MLIVLWIADLRRQYRQVRSYVKMLRGERKVVQVIEHIHHPVRSIICGFYGTVVMNILMWDKVYSLFPMTT